MNYCSNCSAKVTLKIPHGDNLPRYVCDACGAIHYQNPKIVTGCIPEWEDKILLCKRGIEPRRGLWTLPAGFMENQETTAEGAMRETLEESYAKVHNLSLYALFNIPHISQVYILFRGEMLNDHFAPTTESIEVELFAEHQIPWAQIAFPVIKETLKRYYHDKQQGKFRLQVDDIHPLKN